MIWKSRNELGMAATVEQDERESVTAWRLRELLAAGYTYHRADQLAARHDVELHRACELIRDGCPEKLALKILL